MAKVTPISEANAPARLSDWDWFWEEFPRKKAKLDALRAWKQTEKLRPPIEELIAALETQVRACEDVTFFPYPASWLRAGRWMDE